MQIISDSHVGHLQKLIHQIPDRLSLQESNKIGAFLISLFIHYLLGQASVVQKCCKRHLPTHRIYTLICFTVR